MEIKYKEFDRSYTSRVTDLLNICFPKKDITDSSFLWKHCDNFFNNNAVSMIAVDGEKVCAFVCFAPILIASGENIYQNFYSCAVQATHPEYRRRGIVTNLTQAIEKKLGQNAQYLGFSNDAGVKIDKFSKKIGYDILGEMVTRYVLSLPYSSSLKIRKIKELPNINYKPNFSHIAKNNGYLEWRYGRNPKNKYEYFEIQKNGAVVGYIFCKNKNMKYEVSDLLLFSCSPGAYSEAIKSFVNFAFFQGKITVSCSYLRNNFWQRCFPVVSLTKQIGIYFTIKTVHKDLRNVENWMIQGGDIQ